MKRVSLVDSVVEEIKELIIKGDLKDGDMLESQDELAKRMQVSRPSLREALRRLQLMGLIEFRHGCGTFVKTVKPKDFMTPISGFLPIDKKSAFELLEARLFLEGAVAALAAQKATEQDILTLESIVSRMEEAAAKLEVERFASLDVQFHLAVAEMSRNQIMFQIVNILRGLLQKLVSSVFETNQDNLELTFSQTIDYHNAILESVRQHSAAKARTAMEKHIKDVQKKLRKKGDFLLSNTGSKTEKYNLKKE